MRTTRDSSKSGERQSDGFQGPGNQCRARSLVIYQKKSLRNQEAFQQEVRALAAQAWSAVSEPDRLEQSTGMALEQPKLALKRLECAVDVHYGWECLEKLLDAREAGRHILVHSVLLLEGAPEALHRLAIQAVGVNKIHMVDRNLADSFCMNLDYGEAVRFAVAYPAPLPLRGMRPPFVVLDGLVSASNLGHLLRSAALLGVTSFVLPRASWNCLNGRSCRASEGWLYSIDFHLAQSLPEALQELSSMGIHAYAAEEFYSEPVSAHHDASWALVLGNEDRGISQEVARCCRSRVRVQQMRGASLNVAHAAAICMYELSRRVPA